MKKYPLSFILVPLAAFVFLLMAICGGIGFILLQEDATAALPEQLVVLTEESSSDLTIQPPSAIEERIVPAEEAEPTTPPLVEVVPDAPTTELPSVNIQSSAAITAFEDQLVTIYELVNPSVVHIITNAGEGSGFVWDADGNIVTNNHVIAGASQINVVFSDDIILPATLVGTDPDSDLAVIRVNRPSGGLRPVTLGDSTQLKVGELAIAIGNPFGQQGTMTVGFISALGRLQQTESSGSGGSFNMADMIQTDAAINPGNSGGVLVDENGFLIGVTSSIISPVRGSSGIGFAIPSALVARVAPQLIANGAYAHPYLGVSGATVTPEIVAARGLPAGTRGTLLVTIAQGGPADQAGLQGGQQNGDIVIAIDGIAINSMDDLITYLARVGAVGESVTMTLIRGNETIHVDVVLGERPN